MKLKREKKGKRKILMNSTGKTDITMPLPLPENPTQPKLGFGLLFLITMHLPLPVKPTAIFRGPEKTLFYFFVIYYYHALATACKAHAAIFRGPEKTLLFRRRHEALQFFAAGLYVNV
jgi:hypothetical protein